MAKGEIIDLFNLTSQGVDADIKNYQFTITGAYGAGKSSLATALFNRVGKAVTFGCEDRFKGIKDIKIIPIESWKNALDYKKVLTKGLKDNGGKNPFDFDTIILDPVGRLGKMCEEYICEDNMWESLADGGYGKGYNLLEDEFNSFVNDLKRLGFGVNYVAHGRTDTITPPRAIEGYQIFVPDVAKKIKYAVQGAADFVLYLDVLRQVDETTGVNKPVRRLYLQNYADYELKVPLEGFPDYIEYETVDEGVDKFIEAFNEAVKVTKGGDQPKQSKSADKSSTKQKQQKPKTSETNLSIDELRNLAIAIRDQMLKNLDRDFVINKLKSALGTAMIQDCDDTVKLMAFIEEFK